MTEPAKWVGFERVVENGPAFHYECTGVEHLLPNENAGRHNVFIWVKKNGKIVRDGSVFIEYGWNGMGDTKVAPQKCNKTHEDEPSCDIALFLGMEMWVRVLDGNTPSDKVTNLHSKMDGMGGNSLGHHSYNIFFELLDEYPGRPDEPSSPATWQEGYNMLNERLKKLEMGNMSPYSVKPVKLVKFGDPYKI